MTVDIRNLSTQSSNVKKHANIYEKRSFCVRKINTTSKKVL